MSLENALVVNETVNTIRKLANSKMKDSNIPYNVACEEAKNELGIFDMKDLSNITKGKKVENIFDSNYGSISLENNEPELQQTMEKEKVLVKKLIYPKAS